ncbi:MAG: LysM domain-containing protein [Actinomycetota bacterium]|nr:LysM domain-containing protein [Actinomycetota bacterium]
MSTITVYAPTVPRRGASRGARRAPSRAPRHATGTAPGPAAGGIRLTRRGRLVVFVTALGVAMLALVVIAGAVIATSQAGDPVPAQSIEVTSGDTLWDIAARANPGGNVGATVHEIAELNGLSQTGALQVGQLIAVPLY